MYQPDIYMVHLQRMHGVQAPEDASWQGGQGIVVKKPTTAADGDGFDNAVVKIYTFKVPLRDVRDVKSRG